MRRVRKPFSECFGISPGDYSSPGIYRIVILSKVILMVLVAVFAVYVIISCSIGVDAATVSGGDVLVETPVPVTPAPTESPVPTPNYTIENEVILDGANLYSSSDSITVYTQEVVLASETEGASSASAFPEMAGYFVVPIDDSSCAYVPEGFSYWAVFTRGNSILSVVSNDPLYYHADVAAFCSDTSRYVYNIYNQDGSVWNSVTAYNTCSEGRYYYSSFKISSIIAGVYATCVSTSGGKELPDDSILDSITLSSEFFEFVSSDSRSLTATVTPENFSGALTWTSTDESVAKYSGGLVIPVADGTCQIIASYVNPDGTVISASCDVTVSLPVVDEEPTELEEFLREPLEVNRYQYEILKRMEFMQYAQALMIALIFILIFKRK